MSELSVLDAQRVNGGVWFKLNQTVSVAYYDGDYWDPESNATPDETSQCWFIESFGGITCVFPATEHPDEYVPDQGDVFASTYLEGTDDWTEAFVLFTYCIFETGDQNS